jgi:hypothetical protein
MAPGIAETFGGVAGEDEEARLAGFDFQRERPDGSRYKLAELARERASGGRERRQRERAPTEGDSTGEGRECWRRPGVRDSERERVDELSVGARSSSVFVQID